MLKNNEGFLGRGWQFPIKPNASGQLVLTQQDQAVRNSIYLILGTAPGERLMRPDYGCGIHDLVFQPNTPNLRGTIQSQVRKSLVQWEPRIDVLDVRADADPSDPNHLIIRIDYRLRQNNALFNLVYPFYLRESFS